MRSCYRNVIWGLLPFISVLFLSANIHAQPSLTFKRLVERWPSIELYFNVTCDGQPSNNFVKDNFEIQEAGIAVDDFTLWCPQVPCPMSVSLVFDASGSMAGAANAGAKAGAHAFVDMMDGTTDEAAVIWFTSLVNVELGITTNITDLHDAVNALPAAGVSAVWDGIYAGVQEVIQSSSNPCRAVIALTDGSDNSSSHSAEEIIALAQRNRIRVYTIGLGGVTPAKLETMAILTGGKYFQAPSASVIVDIYQEIFAIIHNGFEECMITYNTKCMDGSVRTVDLKLQDFCHGGHDTKTRMYHAPRDTNTFADVDIRIGDASVFDGQSVVLPLTLDGAISSPAYFNAATFHVLYNSGCVTFDKLETPPGTLLNGVPVAVNSVASGIQIATQSMTEIQGPGILGYLHFLPAVNPADSAVCDIDLMNWDFEAGCLKPVLQGGTVKIYNSDIPFIVPEGATQFCEGDSVRLVAADGFTDYKWSTGATTKSIWVTQAGSYWITAKNGAGTEHTSNVIVVEVRPLPSPGIYPEGTVALCHGTQVTIQADGGYEEYRWSTGDSSTSITATREGTFSYMARDANGCWGQSEELTIHYKEPDPEITGDLNLCGKDAIGEYAVAESGSYQYKWTVGGGTPLTRTDSSGIRIRINGKSATISAEVYDLITGCRVTDRIIATLYTGPDSVQVDGGRLICASDSARLWVEPLYDSYEWSTGSTESVTYAKTSGDYYCTVTNGPCTFVTDTVHVTSMSDIQMDITGEAIVCQYAQEEYSAPQVPGIIYNWRLEGESTDAQTGNPVTLKWAGGTSGKVILEYGIPGCIDTLTMNVSLVQGLTPNVAATPDSVVCEGDSVTLHASPGFTDYQWDNGMTGDSIVVHQSGTFSVSAVGPNGCRGYSRKYTVDVVPKPPKPDLTVSGNQISCSVPGMQYRWYLNGTLIPGASTMSIEILQSGSYVVEVIDGNGCSSFSDPLTTTGIGRFAPGLAKEFNVSPNPTDGKMRVSLEFPKPTVFTLQLVNVAGQVVYSEAVNQPVILFQKTIQLEAAAPGMYMFMLSSGKLYDVRKVIIQNR